MNLQEILLTPHEIILRHKGSVGSNCTGCWVTRPVIYVLVLFVRRLFFSPHLGSSFCISPLLAVHCILSPVCMYSPVYLCSMLYGSMLPPFVYPLLVFAIYAYWLLQSEDRPPLMTSDDQTITIWHDEERKGDENILSTKAD